MFEQPFTSLDEYWLGYFRADGSLHHSYGGIFAQARFNPVLEFAKYIGNEQKITSKAQMTNFGFYVYHRARVPALIAKRLYSIGTKGDLDPSLYESKHFWRGMIDGDGCIKRYNKRPPDKWDPGLGLVGNQVDVKAFSDFVARLLSCGSPKVFHNSRSNVFAVDISGNKAKYVLHHLYEKEFTANIKKYARVKEILDRPWSTHHNSWKLP